MATLIQLEQLVAQSGFNVLPKPQMAALFNLEGPALVAALEKLGADGDQDARRFVKTALQSAAPYTSDVVAKLGLVAPLRTVLAAARAHPEFFSWVRAVKDRQDRQAAAKLREALAPRGGAPEGRAASDSESKGARARIALVANGADGSADKGDPDRLPVSAQTSKPNAGPAPTARPAQAPAAASEEPRAAPPDERRSADGKFEPGEHVYGGGAALTFSPAMSRSGKHVVMLEAALASGTREYDWNNKICLQLSPAEMLTVYAVFRGWLQSTESRAHGEANDKSFKVEDQHSKFYVAVNQKGAKVRGVPVTPQDACRVMLLIAKQIVRNDPILRDINGVDRIAELTAKRLVAAPAPAREAQAA